MDPAVTITPDAPPSAPVTITPDAAPRTWEDSIGDFGKALWNQINPVSGIEGAAQMVNHPIDTFKNDGEARQQVYDEAEKAFKKGDYTGGAAHLLYSVLPLIGPQLDAAGNDFAAGNYAKGAGASIGMGLAMAAPEAVADSVIPALKGAAQRTALLGRTPAEAYESALKPSTTLSPAEREGVVQTGLQNKIPVSKKGLADLNDLIDDTNSKIRDAIQGDPTRPINPAQAVQNLRGVRNRFATQVNPAADVNAVEQAGQEFLDQFRSQPGSAVRNMTAEEAQAMKQGTYRALGDKAYGELKGASIEAQKALARGLKDEIAQQFPEIQSLNARDSEFYDLQGVLEKAVNRIGNRQLIGIGSPIAGAATTAVTGSANLGKVAMVLKAVLDDPTVKSRLAIAVNKAGVPLPAAFAKVAAYSDSLGQFVPHDASQSGDHSPDQ